MTKTTFWNCAGDLLCSPFSGHPEVAEQCHSKLQSTSSICTACSEWDVCYVEHLLSIDFQCDGFLAESTDPVLACENVVNEAEKDERVGEKRDAGPQNTGCDREPPAGHARVVVPRCRFLRFVLAHVFCSLARGLSHWTSGMVPCSPSQLHIWRTLGRECEVS